MGQGLSKETEEVDTRGHVRVRPEATLLHLVDDGLEPQFGELAFLWFCN